MIYNSMIVRVKEVYSVHLIIIFLCALHTFCTSVRSPNIEDNRNPLDNRVFDSARQSLFIFYRISDLWRSLLHFTREEPRETENHLFAINSEEPTVWHSQLWIPLPQLLQTAETLLPA